MSRLMSGRLASSGVLICMCCGSRLPVLEAIPAGGRIFSDMDAVRTCICPDCFSRIGERYPCLGYRAYDNGLGLRS